MTRRLSSRWLRDTVAIESGHVGRSGSVRHYLARLERRANLASDSVVACGIAPDEIVFRAFGKENPVDPTWGSMREPQNGRVEKLLS